MAQTHDHYADRDNIIHAVRNPHGRRIVTLCRETQELAPAPDTEFFDCPYCQAADMDEY